jgi:hypothetical protein
MGISGGVGSAGVHGIDVPVGVDAELFRTGICLPSGRNLITKTMGEVVEILDALRADVVG